MQPNTYPQVFSAEFRGLPDFCIETTLEPIEPIYGIMRDLMRFVQDHTPREDDIFAEPTAALFELRSIADRLEGVSYYSKYNPEYDAEKCQSWREEVRRDLNAES